MMSEQSTKMDPTLKAKWVEALRSGEYLQTRKVLTDGEGYCCLGVLCRVAGLPIRSDGDGIVGAIGEIGSYQPIFNLVGSIDNSHALSMRNDGAENYRPHSFAEIADYIEQNL